jgi:hypothetical protein
LNELARDFNIKFGLGGKENDRVALVAHLGERSNARRIFVGKNLNKIDHPEAVTVEGG